MHMVIDACAGNAAEVGTKIETVGFVQPAKGLLGPCREGENLGLFFVPQFFNRIRVFIRDDHHMAAVVRIQIHDNKGMSSPINDEILRIPPLPGHPAEQAFSGFFRVFERLYVGRSPGGEETLHKRRIIGRFGV